MTQTDNSTAINSVSSVHHYMGYITDVELVNPKPEQGQKKEPTPYFKVSATLHNGRTSKKSLKYVYSTLLVTDAIENIVEEVMLELNNRKDLADEGEKVSIKCNLTVRDVTASPYISRGKAGINWGGHLTELEVLNKPNDAS